MSLPPQYFDELYAAKPDPWGFTNRTYEARKRDLTLACLPDPQFGRAFEPGCSIGMLTEALAGRCRSLLATDISPAAVRQARNRLADLAHVCVEQRAVPAEWPAGPFDLIVISEIGYYLSAPDADQVAALAVRALEPAGVLIVVHWRHPVPDYPLPGDRVHEIFTAHAKDADLHRLVCHQEIDLLLDVWSPDPRSVAERSGLLP
ncbi:MAG TPA: SAM-dependent methyltransferase [Mycobacteriales bacterium]|jgi:SAM-dependent methyltransferase|nr:SAM-dependent methyltransferase [Mycobacteriales bacterium]